MSWEWVRGMIELRQEIVREIVRRVVYAALAEDSPVDAATIAGYGGA